LIEAGRNKLCSEIDRLITCIWNKEELSEQRKGSIIVPIYKNGDETEVVIIEEYHSHQLQTILSSNLTARLTPHLEAIIGDH
jgi:hypothetical protein